MTSLLKLMSHGKVFVLLKVSQDRNISIPRQNFRKRSALIGSGRFVCKFYCFIAMFFLNLGVYSSIVSNVFLHLASICIVVYF